jgi:hypothetical protein
MLRTTIPIILLFLFLASSAVAQNRKNDEKYTSLNPPAFDDPTRVSPNMNLSTDIGSMHVSLEWGAPSVRGRLLTGGLISTYKVWRTGANEATVIQFDSDVLIEGERLPAGTYSLFTIGGKKKWTIIFNEEYQQWGAFTYDRKKDVLRVKVEPGTGDMTEQLLFELESVGENEALMHIRWGTIAVAVSVATAEQS